MGGAGSEAELRGAAIRVDESIHFGKPVIKGARVLATDSPTPGTQPPPGNVTLKTVGASHQ